MAKKIALPIEMPLGYERLWEGELNMATDMMFVCPVGWVKLNELSELTQQMLPNDAKSLWAVCRKKDDIND